MSLSNKPKDYLYSLRKGKKMKKKNIDFLYIQDLHESIFPFATPQSQLLHLAEEIGEYLSAETIREAMEELADVIIVLVSLRRWKSTRALSDDLLSKYYFELPIEERKTMMKFVSQKIQIVSTRAKLGVYKWNGVDYNRERYKSILE